MSALSENFRTMPTSVAFEGERVQEMLALRLLAVECCLGAVMHPWSHI